MQKYILHFFISALHLSIFSYSFSAIAAIKASNCSENIRDNYSPHIPTEIINEDDISDEWPNLGGTLTAAQLEENHRYLIQNSQVGVDRNIDLAEGEAYVHAIKAYEYSISLLENTNFDIREQQEKAKLGFEYLRLASSLGHKDAHSCLATCFQHGRGTPKNVLLAAVYLEYSAALGDPESQYELACFYRNIYLETQIHPPISPIKKWDELSFHLYSESSKSGHTQSQFELGLCYFFGFGVVQNDGLAFACFTEAAEKENAQAQFSLSICYKSGKGIVKNEALSLYWMDRAAFNGHIEACKQITHYVFNAMDRTNISISS